MKALIEELEEKNKKLIETMNTHIYNKAADYKQRTMNALQRGNSPNRSKKLEDMGISTHV